MSKIHHFGIGILLNVPFSSNLLSSFGGRFKCGWNHNREFNFWKKLTLTHFNLLFILCIICLSYYYISKKSKYHKNLHLPLDLRFIFISPQEYLSPILNKKGLYRYEKTYCCVCDGTENCQFKGKVRKMSIFHLIQYFRDFDNIEHLNLMESSSLLVTFPRKRFFLFDGPKFGKKCSCT